MVAITLLVSTAIAVAGPTLPPRGIAALGLKRDKLDIMDCRDGGLRCGGNTQSRYRLTSDADREISSKDRAFATDGKRCPLMGPALCPGEAFPVYRSGQDPLETIATSLRPIAVIGEAITGR